MSGGTRGRIFMMLFNRFGKVLCLSVALGLSFGSWASAQSQQLPVWKAQSGNEAFRINELENQVRVLNGRIEEMNFQMLQMQEQIRRMQEDNELRFQELEDKQSDASDSLTGENDTKIAGRQTDRLGKPQPSEPETGSDENSADTNQLAAKNTTGEEPEPPKPQRGSKPRLLGTLTFDKDGNVQARSSDGTASQSGSSSNPLPGIFNDGVDGGVEAAEFGPTPDAVFAVAKTALERKRFNRSESAFRAHLKAWPEDPRHDEARYYLGKVLFEKQDYYNAANVFLDTHNAYPNAVTAADNLLGLGLSLAGLNQREVACATYSEVLRQYPQAEARLGEQVRAEQTSANC